VNCKGLAVLAGAGQTRLGQHTPGWAQQAGHSRPGPTPTAGGGRWDVGCGQPERASRGWGCAAERCRCALQRHPCQVRGAQAWRAHFSQLSLSGLLPQQGKRFARPAEDRFVIVNCQWRSNVHATGVRHKGREAGGPGDMPTSTGPVLFPLQQLGDEKLGWRCVVCRFCSAVFAGGCPHEIPSAASSFVGSMTRRFPSLSGIGSGSPGLVHGGRFIRFKSDTSHHSLRQAWMGMACRWTDT